MYTVVRVVLLALLVIHGLIHFMGFVAYFPLGEMSELPYKTAFLGGRLELGIAGTRLFSVLWFVTAVGFVVAAVGLIANSSWAVPLLVGTTVLSLIIAILDWSVSWRGALVDVAILIVVFAGPKIAELLGWTGS